MENPYRKYDGPHTTTRHICHILPRLLEEIGKIYRDRPDLVLAAWPEVIGPKLAAMTKALSFCNGILTVKVSNSPLYSLLNQHDKRRLIKSLRDKFPEMTIKTIVFRQ